MQKNISQVLLPQIKRNIERKKKKFGKLREIFYAYKLKTINYSFIPDEYLANIEKVYSLLSDQYSKDAYLYSIFFRLHDYFPKSLRKLLDRTHNFNDFDVAFLENVESTDKNTIDINDYKLNLYNLEKYGFDQKLYVMKENVYVDYILKQYEYHNNGISCEVNEGDNVVDGGGCFADTALYFAFKNKGKGKIYSYEFIKENIEIFTKNLELNPKYSENICLIKHALWDKSDLSLFIVEDGPASYVSMERPKGYCKEIKTLTIDDLVLRNNIDKIDFIKMDIEGAEMEALKGAEQTIISHRPKLAITLYHKDSHFWEIPLLIKQYLPDSKLYFKHFTYGVAESVLFVNP